MSRFYANSLKSWYPSEDSDLIIGYTRRNQDIIKLSNIHKRTPDRIIKRLKALKIIKHAQEANGYTTFKNSNLAYLLNVEPSHRLESIVEEDEEESTCVGTSVSTGVSTGTGASASISQDHNDHTWTNEEIQKLIDLYNSEKLPLPELSKTLNRKPHDVIEQLKVNKVVRTLTEINGYTTYKKSHEYDKHQSELRQKKLRTLQEKSEAANPLPVFRSEVLSLRNEIKDLKSSINELKSSFVTLSRFINSTFRFAAPKQ